MLAAGPTTIPLNPFYMTIFLDFIASAVKAFFLFIIFDFVKVMIKSSLYAGSTIIFVHYVEINDNFFRCCGFTIRAVRANNEN